MTPVRNAPAACLIWLALTGCDERPTRSECIIGFTMDWSKVKADRNDVRNSMFWPEGSQRIEPLAGTAISLDGTRLYLQFAHDCDDKEEMAEALMAYWRAEGLDLPKFARIDEPIVPSTETIDQRGPSWSDGWPDDTYDDSQ